ncbi:MAG: DUF1491 family protein [Pseudomonadota bacterium]|nr:DUF1491 family protein [Pseudomonadota bacterium]
MDNRLPVHLEVSGLLRRAEVEGGFAMVIARGDPDRGALVLLIARRGVHFACLERGPGANGDYEWQTVGPAAGATPESVQTWSQKRRSNDPDLWLIELDVALPERFIAETIAIG